MFETNNDNKDIRCYTSTGCTVSWKYTSSLKDNASIVNIKDLLREKCVWCGIKPYIDQFVECLKEKVIRYLPKLDEVNVMFGVFDRDNVFHRLTIAVLERIGPNSKDQKNYYKCIYVVIMYEGRMVFAGALSFDGII